MADSASPSLEPVVLAQGGDPFTGYCTAADLEALAGLLARERTWLARCFVRPQLVARGNVKTGIPLSAASDLLRLAQQARWSGRGIPVLDRLYVPWLCWRRASGGIIVQTRPVSTGERYRRNSPDYALVLTETEPIARKALKIRL